MNELVQAHCFREKRRQSMSLFHQGLEDGDQWTKAVHPSGLRLSCYHFRYWMAPSSTDASPLWLSLLKTMPDFRDRGRQYTVGFAKAVHGQWEDTEAVWTRSQYVDGVADGKSWAAGAASSEELARLRAADKEDLPNIYDGLFRPTCTGAHKVLSLLRGKRGLPELEEIIAFWHQFVSVDLDDYRCKLFAPEYSLGFANGAIALPLEQQPKFVVTNEGATWISP